LELNRQISGISEIQRAQDNTKTDLLSIAAHEPIQPVLGLAEMLQSRKNIHPQEQEEFLAIIIRNAKRLKDLTENILDLTKIETQPEQRISRYKRYNTALHSRHQKSAIWQSKCRRLWIIPRRRR
jgi:signal transduction histidine kinase